MSDSSSRIAPHRWASPDVPDDERHRHVFTYIRSIEQNQSDIRLQMFRDAYLYTGEELSGLSIEWVGRSTITPDRARMNFVGGLIETARSRIAQRRPRLAVTSRAANWSLRQKAIGLERYLDGDFVRTKFARTAQRVFRDGAAVGTGIGKVYAWGGKVNVDRIFPLEVVVDEEACGSGLPMEMFQRRFIDVDLAIAEYGDGKPELEDMIWRSAKGDGRWTGYIKYNKNLVPIVDAYRRPSATGADDGLHVMCVKEGMIVQEDCAMLPFLIFRWQEKMTGWYGLGIPDLVYWLQARLNRHAAFEEACQDRHANPRVVVDGQLDAQLSQSMTNEIGVIVPSYGRFPPKFENPPAVPPEIYRDEDRKIEMMHHVIGLSESSVSGRKEPGLDSAPGQREWQGWQEGRFSSQVEGYDDLYVEGAELYIHTAKKLAEEGRRRAGTAPVTVSLTSSGRTSTWSATATGSAYSHPRACRRRRRGYASGSRRSALQVAFPTTFTSISCRRWMSTPTFRCSTPPSEPSCGRLRRIPLRTSRLSTSPRTSSWRTSSGSRCISWSTTGF